jgi:hypothetical protein
VRAGEGPLVGEFPEGGCCCESETCGSGLSGGAACAASFAGAAKATHNNTMEPHAIWTRRITIDLNAILRKVWISRQTVEHKTPSILCERQMTTPATPPESP